MEHFAYLDTETIPSQDPSVIAEIGDRYPVPEIDLDAIRPAENLVDPVKIEADIEKKRAKAIEAREAALDKAAAARDKDYRDLSKHGGAGAHLACISCAIDGEDVQGFRNEALAKFNGRYSIPSFQEVIEGEREMLSTFFVNLRFSIRDAWAQRVEDKWDEMEAKADSYGLIDLGNDHVRRLPSVGREAWIAAQRRFFADLPVIVAHFAEFDVRLIWQRSKILGVTPPVWWPVDFNRHKTDEVVDTMAMWSGHNGRISLDDLCRALGVPGKDGMDGSGVWDAIQQGRLDEVGIYCNDDVERVRAVHKILRRQPRGMADELFEAASAAADADHGVAEEQVA